MGPATVTGSKFGDLSGVAPFPEICPVRISDMRTDPLFFTDV